MVKQSGEPFLLPYLAASYTINPWDTLSRLVSGACGSTVFPSAPLAPSTPPRLPGLFATLLLCRGLTSPARASSARAPRLPDADHALQLRGHAEDLPVPVQRAYVHARVSDHAGPVGHSQ